MSEVAKRISQDLDLLLQIIRMDSEGSVDTGDPATVARCFEESREMVNELDAKLKLISKHVDRLSTEILPTMFANKGMKSANFQGVGMVKIVQRWSAKMLDPPACMQWLRDGLNGGVIKETVHHETLGAMARVAATAGHPLPSNLFEVGTSNYTSITKS